MLRYKTETKPGLVALYNIRPGNGAGPFLQPRSPHGATVREMTQLLREVFLANHLASNDNLTRTTKRRNTYNAN